MNPNNKWRENSGTKWPKRMGKVMFTNKKKAKKQEEDEGSEVKRLIGQRNVIDSSKIINFNSFPLSRRTLDGLKEANYVKPTEIQKEAIGLALRGLDILGAAQTGSGKTLAFLIPIMELLYTKLWTKSDGLGALIITPTRELAYQIFETLRKIGKRHEFSAALVIGGKDLKFEKKRMDQVNILICTPGRLLQHMDENAMFDCLSLQILVLDEADRCLDMGFQETMNAIIANLPKDRQTLLFSATQTKSVKDLGRLSLKSPVYVSVHENSQFSTPDTLQQSYMVCPLESKLDVLWSFLKHHKRSKILVFLSSCKQVRFVHMLFCRMRPGTSLLALYGSLHQLKRMSVYEDFCKKQAVVLFATDIAARGLDFPEVDWVIQLDCPEDATTYIHRVGRTARYNRNGEALLVLLPSEEEAALGQLNQKKIPIEKIEVNPKKLMTIRRKFEALLARDITLKDCAQRAFKAYLKSVFLMKNKDVFSVEQLDLPSFAQSLGLAVAPRVRFLQKKIAGKAKLQPKLQPSGGREEKQQSSLEIKEEDSESEEEEEKPSISKLNSTFDFNVDSDDNECADDLFRSKKPSTLNFGDTDENEVGAISENQSQKSKKVKTKATLAKKLIKKKIQVNKKFNFDEEGDAILDVRKEKQSDFARSYENENVSGIDIEKAKQILKLEDKYDKELFREIIRARHREKRLKAKSDRKSGRKNKDDDDNEVPSNKDIIQIGNHSDEDQFSHDSDDYQPNLDWLPDPDKVYGNRDEEDIEGYPIDSECSPSNTAKAAMKKKSAKRKADQGSDEIGTISKLSRKSSRKSKDMSSALMEKLAMELLQK